jgi:hypothetical protein
MRFPPLFHTSLGGHKVSIELRASTYAAPYLCYRNRPQASIDSPHRPRELSEIIEAEQPTRSAVPSQTGTEALE